jgi:Uma2 family endonuclease
MSTVPDTAETVVRASHVPGPAQGQWTYADYAVLAEPDGFRYEIIDGVLYMAPAPLPEHERVGAVLIGRLVVAVEDTALGHVFISPDIDVGPHTLRPDAVIVLNHNLAVVDAKRLIGAPDLVVEIASPSTAAYDRDADTGKRAIYARIGIPEYWIVDPATQRIEVYTLVGDHYALLDAVAGDTMLRSRVLPQLQLPARQYFPRTPTASKG